MLESSLAIRLYNRLLNEDSAAWESLDHSQETLAFLVQHQQTSPAHIREKMRAALAKYLAQSQGSLAARQSWAELYLLAPDEWKADALDISGLDFQWRTFAGLRLSTFRADNANLAETRWKDCAFTHSSWRGANCRQTVFENIEGEEADFSDANLRTGRWKKVTLQKQDFSGANCDGFQRSACAGQVSGLPPEALVSATD